ncbi:16604_t:CDS:2, partial [Cetraspora pellucida]
MPIIEKKSQSSDSDIDNIMAAFKALTINHVKHKTNEVSRIDKIEIDIREMIKAIKQLINNQRSDDCFNFRNSELIRNSRLYNDIQEELREKRNKNIEIREANIKYFKIILVSNNPEIKCLKVKI